MNKKEIFIHIDSILLWRWPMFVDTHCHLNMMTKKKSDVLLSKEDLILIESFLNEAKENGVNKIVTVGTSVNESFNSVNIAKAFEGVFASVGIHPCDCNDTWRSEFNEIKKLIKSKKENKIVAVGETGLDFYHKPFNKQRQVDAFKEHINCALEYELPAVIHVRESAEEVLKVLEEYKSELNGVVHCFMQDKDFADVILGWGFFVGINAPITYPKNKWFVDVVKDIPVEKIILETDAPFLPPQQFRGKQNKPSYIPIFAKTLAEIKGISLSELGKITTRNAEKLFGI